MITTTILTWLSKLFLETGWPYVLGRVLLLFLFLLLLWQFRDTIRKANFSLRNIRRDNVLGIIVALLGFFWVAVPWGQQYMNTRLRDWKTALEPGLEAYEAGEYKKAVPILTKAADAFPEASLIHLYLGNAYRELDNSELAEPAYKKVLLTADTGHWPVKAREALREMNVSSPLVTEPIHVDMSMQDIKTMRAEGSPVAQSLATGLTWFFALSGFLMGYSFAWFLLAADIATQDEGPLVSNWFMISCLVFIGLWVISQWSGAYHQTWFTGFSGWHPYWLEIKVALSMMLMFLFAKLAYNNPNLRTSLLLFVLCIGFVFLTMAWLGDRPDKIAVLLAGTISIVSVIWGAGAMRSLGDLSDSSVLSALTRSIIAIFAWLVLPVAAHLIVFFKVMPWLAVQRNWSIPNYFWESAVIQWIQNVSGGLL